jgi:hypothetical protein
MDIVTRMMRAHPLAAASGDDELIRCIEECFACAQACTTCADACLSEPDVANLRVCIGLNLACAHVCQLTGMHLSRPSSLDVELSRAILLACIQACRSCGEECERHAEQHEHCRVCAESCNRCESACEDAIAAFTG